MRFVPQQRGKFILQHIRESNKLHLTAASTDQFHPGLPERDPSLLGGCGDSFIVVWRIRQPSCQFPEVPNRAGPCPAET